MPVRGRTRLLVAVLLASLASFRTWQLATHHTYPRDIAQVWYASRALLHGDDPYPLIGPGRPFDWPAPLSYPLTAAVALVPLAPLSQLWASVAFSFLGAACFAWALMRHGYAPLLGFASAAMVESAEFAQWSPLLSAGLILLPLSMLYAAKPSVGLAYFLARPSWWAIGGMCGLALVAFAAQPDWVTAWLGALKYASFVRGTGFPYIAPALMPGGFLVLLALLRWRRPEGRLLAALACVPHTLLPYETLPLFLIPRSLREAEVLFALSWLASIVASAKVRGTSFGGYIDVNGQYIVLLLYLPATLMVLKRPNRGPAPRWLERRIVRWPQWIRGTSLDHPEP